MADNSFEAQGSELFLSIDGTTVLKFDCPTAINSIGFSSGKVPNGCLDSTRNTSRPGNAELNDISVPYNMQSGSEAHEYLANAMNSPRVEIPYCIALSDGTDDPTIVAGEFVVPGGAGTATRSTYTGTCYISGNAADISQGGLVTGSFTFSPQSQVFTPKAA